MLRRRGLLIALGLVVFLAVSAVLARWLSVENAERDDVLGLLQSEARGNAAALAGQLHGCDAACGQAERANAARLRRPGSVQILSLQSPTAYSLGSATGRTRVAWDVPGRLPVVQCVTVHRHGNILTGISVSLLALSAPIGNTADC